MSKNLPATYKPCPKCGGTGRILCDGKEFYRERAARWAASVDHHLVTVPFLLQGTRSDPTIKDKWIRVPGLAIFTGIGPGGWARVRVYISVDHAPDWGHFRYGWDDEFDEIDGHRLYYLEKGYSQKESIIPIESQIVTPELSGVLQLVSQGFQIKEEKYE